MKSGYLLLGVLVCMGWDRSALRGALLHYEQPSAHKRYFHLKIASYNFPRIQTDLIKVLSASRFTITEMDFVRTYAYM